MNNFHGGSWLFLSLGLRPGIMMMAYILHAESQDGLCLENIYIS